MTWLQAFALTQLLEVPIYLLGSRAASWSLGQRAVLAFGASALTHPVVWFVLPRLLGGLGYWPYVAGAETFAVLAEALYLRGLGVANPLRLSLAANGVSAGVGLLIYAALA